MTRAEAGRLGWLKSKAERDAVYTARIATYAANPTRCKNCNVDLAYAHRTDTFCSHACSAHFNNKGVRRHGMPRAACLHCGAPVKWKNSKYCSCKCFSAAAAKRELTAIVKAGYVTKRIARSVVASDGRLIRGDNRRAARRYLLETQGSVCAICGLRKWQGVTIPLVVDHIDGDSDNGDLSNIRLVCGNCDMLLPTYKGRNRGHGRAWRHQRYAQGKSY